MGKEAAVACFKVLCLEDWDG